MEDSKKIFIRGSKEHGYKAIEYLRELSNGGVFSAWNCLSDNCIYFLDHSNNICCLRQEEEMAKIVMDNYKEVTIDEVLAHFAEKEKFSYDGKHRIDGCRIKLDSTIEKVDSCAIKPNMNIFAVKKQAKSALAMAQISQYMANDKRYGGVVTDEEWYCDRCIDKYVIMRLDNELSRGMRNGEYHFLAFHTAEQRELFIKEHEDLVNDYLMID